MKRVLLFCFVLFVISSGSALASAVQVNPTSPAVPGQVVQVNDVSGGNPYLVYFDTSSCTGSGTFQAEANFNGNVFSSGGVFGVRPELPSDFIGGQTASNGSFSVAPFTAVSWGADNYGGNPANGFSPYDDIAGVLNTVGVDEFRIGFNGSLDPGAGGATILSERYVCPTVATHNVAAVMEQGIGWIGGILLALCCIPILRGIVRT